MRKKRIGIGYENYKEFIDKSLYFVDKTLLIRDIIESGAKAILFTRPRRFGKTLALSMLRTFFEAEYDRDGNPADNRRYFDGMKVMESGTDVISKMGQHPVIKLSFKSAGQPDFYISFMKLREEIIREFGRHSYIGHSDKVDQKGKAAFNDLWNGAIDWREAEKAFKSPEEKNEALKQECGRYATAIKTLSECLRQHHGRNVVMLIDEYDVPLENAYTRGFYPEMVDFIRSLFESALKTNDSLELAVVTGCLRISRESIFTGLNNLQVNSVRSKNYGEYFGFTETETEGLLKYFDLDCNIDVVREWYDGYLFGESEVYNPWSITTYIYEHLGSPDRLPEPYWSNTSSNSIIKTMVDRADNDTREELDLLINGGTIEKQVHEDITYDEIFNSEDNLWNFLFFTGYMKKVSERAENGDIYMTMKIPNAEVAYIYRNHIQKWFRDIIKKSDRTDLYQAIYDKNCDAIGEYISKLLRECISTMDSAESFYHGFFLSLLSQLPDYSVRSNREAGDGRPDIILYPQRYGIPAYIFELKRRKNFNEMRNGLEEAVNQIKAKKYEDGILEEGYESVISYGLCFCRKSCIAGLCGG